MITLNELSSIGNGRIVLNRYNYRGELNQQPILTFCKDSGVDIKFLELIWDAFILNTMPDAATLRTFNSEMILEYLEKTHSYYLNKMIPEIEFALIQLLQQNSKHTAQIIELLEIFFKYTSKLKAHISEEENLFFNYSRQVINKQRALITYSVAEFTKEHIHHEEDIDRIIVNLRQIQDVESALQIDVVCTKLRLLKQDLDIHAFVEDEVLAPNIEALERKMK